MLYLAATTPMIQTRDTIRVEFSERTTIDDEGVHVTAFYQEPKETLIFPNVDRTQAQFFDLFYTRQIDDDYTISVMLLKKVGQDELYIDVNNDEDLTNDGSPYFFPENQNEFIVEIVSRKDPQQRLKLLLQRRPVSKDPQAPPPEAWLLDSAGNLKENVALMYGRGVSSFKGNKGTFYFDDRITLSRGETQIAGKKYLVGLFDYNNNGLFNENQGEKFDDLLFIDLDHDGKLSFATEAEIFKLNDVFQIDGQQYKLAHIDPYGRYANLVATDEKPTFYYLKAVQQTRLQRDEPATTIDDSFWQLNLAALDGKNIAFHEFKGKYLLLNFWGEWCKPCVAEIPELVEAYKNIPREKLEIISFLQTSNLELAKRMIADKMMQWHHVMLSEEIASQFKIREYPTNILIAPDGKVIRRTFGINRTFLYQFVQ
jgi:thiol-disulfide isomerase/thioredoxin